MATLRCNFTKKSTHTRWRFHKKVGPGVQRKRGGGQGWSEDGGDEGGGKEVERWDEVSIWLKYYFKNFFLKKKPASRSQSSFLKSLFNHELQDHFSKSKSASWPLTRACLSFFSSLPPPPTQSRDKSGIILISKYYAVGRKFYLISSQRDWLDQYGHCCWPAEDTTGPVPVKSEVTRRGWVGRQGRDTSRRTLFLIGWKEAEGTGSVKWPTGQNTFAASFQWQKWTPILSKTGSRVG